MILLSILLSCSQKHGGNRHAELPPTSDIYQVASQYIDMLYQSKEWQVFRLNLPPQGILADHQTGPRIIVLLSDLKGQRLDDGTEFKAAMGDVFYLENSFSRGFKNQSEYKVSYLVFSLLSDSGVKTFVDSDCPSGLSRLKLPQSPVAVCLVEHSGMIELQHQVFKYDLQHGKIEKIAKQQVHKVEIGDWLFVMP